VEERIEYQRQNRYKLKKRSECCYPIPLIRPDGGGEDGDASAEIDPDAILWNQHHKDGLACSSRPFCPYCICFTCLHILYKLSSHAALLQCRDPPEKFALHSEQRDRAEMLLERAKHFIPAHIAAQLPGGYIQDTG